jgi:hypothetical protein
MIGLLALKWSPTLL